jgi:hypothetical protein
MRTLLIAVSVFTCWCSFAQGIHLGYSYVTPEHNQGTGHGTCFAVDKTHVLTAAHNVNGDMWIELDDGKHPVKVVKSDPELDLALLKVDGVELTVTKFGKELDSGKVIFNGCPRGEPARSFEGEVVRRFWKRTCMDLAKVKFDHGMSGCPVLSKGKIVGMAVAGVPDKSGKLSVDVGLYLPLSVIKWFLAFDRGNQLRE